MQESSVRLPRAIHLQALQGWPTEQWCWASVDDGAPIRVAPDEPPVAYAEPVAIAMLSAWAEHQRLGARKVIIDPESISPLTYQTGLLAGLAGDRRSFTGSYEHIRTASVVLERERELHDDTFVETLESLGLEPQPRRWPLHRPETLAPRPRRFLDQERWRSRRGTGDVPARSGAHGPR